MRVSARLLPVSLVAQLPAGEAWGGQRQQQEDVREEDPPLWREMACVRSRGLSKRVELPVSDANCSVCDYSVATHHHQTMEVASGRIRC